MNAESVRNVKYVVNKILEGMPVREAMMRAPINAPSFDLVSWKNGNDRVYFTKASVKEFVDKALSSNDSYSASVEKVTLQKVVLCFMTSDDTGFWEKELSAKFKSLTKYVQSKLRDFGVMVGSPYEYTFGWDNVTDSPCVYVSYDIKGK